MHSFGCGQHAGVGRPWIRPGPACFRRWPRALAGSDATRARQIAASPVDVFPIVVTRGVRGKIALYAA